MTSNPHLVRLGDWLVDKEEQSASEKWRLERMFMKTPWIWDLKVILVESPDYDNIMVPFVMIWSNKEKSHANCAFAKQFGKDTVNGQQQVMDFLGNYRGTLIFFLTMLIEKLLTQFLVFEIHCSLCKSFREEIEVVVQCSCNILNPLKSKYPHGLKTHGIRKGGHS